MAIIIDGEWEVGEYQMTHNQISDEKAATHDPFLMPQSQ
jgi:hypothetical protein